MATLTDLSIARTNLEPTQVAHLARLVASWSLLSDLSFSDLLLLVPTRYDYLVVLGQMRPQNRATIVGADLLGAQWPCNTWPLALDALRDGERIDGDAVIAGVGTVPASYIPVGCAGETIAICGRFHAPRQQPASTYERAYLAIFDRLSVMVEEATLPFREVDVAGTNLPRVGDGLMVVNDHGIVEYATPNATNAMHRLGLYDSLEDHRLDDLGLQTRAVDRALEFALPVVDEITRGPEVAIQLHCIPLIASGSVTGALVLLRDVTDLRRLNRVVLSKDQAIQEVHHRVKNNLQTISSLLRLQARRSAHPESATELLEAERRVRAIAVVHEALSREPGEEVEFAGIVRALVAMAEDAVLVPGSIEIMVSGDLGVLGTDVATPLAIVLAELVTNSVEHAFADFRVDGSDSSSGSILLTLSRSDVALSVDIRDNGSGVSEDFSIDATTSLGLSIVRDLVRNQLSGSIEVAAVAGAQGGGTRAVVRIPLVESTASHTPLSSRAPDTDFRAATRTPPPGGGELSY